MTLLIHDFARQRLDIQMAILDVFPDAPRNCFIVYDRTWLETARKTHKIQLFNNFRQADEFETSNRISAIVVQPFEELIEEVVMRPRQVVEEFCRRKTEN